MSPDQYDNMNHKAQLFCCPHYKQSRVLNFNKTAYESCVIYYSAIGGKFQLASYMEKVFLHLKFRT